MTAFGKIDSALKAIIPENEPAVNTGHAMGVVTAALGFLVAFNIIPNSTGQALSADMATFLPLMAGALPVVTGYLIRPKVSPTSTLGKVQTDVVGALNTVEKAIVTDGSDGFPASNDNAFLESDTHQPNAAASTMLAQQASDGSAASVAAGLPVVAPPSVPTIDVPVVEST